MDMPSHLPKMDGMLGKPLHLHAEEASDRAELVSATLGDLPLSLDLDNDPGTMTWSVGDVDLRSLKGSLQKRRGQFRRNSEPLELEHLKETTSSSRDSPSLVDELLSDVPDPESRRHEVPVGQPLSMDPHV
ncbi:unnamed protein product [Durusdinium trenchii]